MLCNKCGNMNDDNSNFCIYCSNPLRNNVDENNVGNINNSNNGDNKKRNYLKILLFCVGMLVGALLTILVLIFVFKINFKNVDSSDKDGNKDSNISDKNNNSYEYPIFDKFDINKFSFVDDVKSAYSKNIELIDKYYNEQKKAISYKKIYLYGKNNNKEGVRIRFETEYYDKDNKKIGVSYGDNIVVAPNSEFVGWAGVAPDSKYDYESYKVIYITEKLGSKYKFYSSSEFDLKSNKNDYNIEIVATPKESIVVERIDAMSLFYKDNKIVFALNGNYLDYDTKEMKDTFIIKTSFSELATNEDSYPIKYIDYDRYEVKIVSAYYSEKQEY